MGPFSLYIGPPPGSHPGNGIDGARRGRSLLVPPPPRFLQPFTLGARSRPCSVLHSGSESNNKRTSLEDEQASGHHTDQTECIRSQSGQRLERPTQPGGHLIDGELVQGQTRLPLGKPPVHNPTPGLTQSNTQRARYDRVLKAKWPQNPVSCKLR